MDFKEKAREIYREFMVHAHELEIYAIETSVEKALQEAHSLGVKQGREEQRERDAGIIEKKLTDECSDVLFAPEIRMLQRLKEEILSAKGSE